MERCGMGKSLRTSVIDNIRDIPWGTHFCQFYQTKEDLIDILVPYFKAGLKNNEFCMWVTSQPLGVENAKEALGMAVPDIDAYLEKGQIEIIPYNYWYVKEGKSGSDEGGFDSERVLNYWVEKLNHALASGYEGVRVSGNTFWLEKEGWNDFIEYEEEIDNVIGNFNMIALCTYSLDRCNVTEIIDVVSNHQFALIKREGKWEQLESSSRKRAGKEAAQAAKDWEYTFDAVPDLIAILDTKYQVFHANKAMAARLGVTKEECVGLTCYRIVHETNEPPSFCPHRRLLKDGLEHTEEVFEDCLGGYFLVSVSPLHDSEGKLIGSVHVARDINERKQTEEALIRSENKFRTLAENSPDIIVRFDRQNRHIYANPAAAEPYCKPPEEIIGKTHGELGMDSEKAKFWERHHENVFATGKPETIEFHYTAPQGKEYYFNTRIIPEFIDGEVTSVLAISRDITEKKEAEAKLKETLNNLEKLVEERTIQLEKAYNSLKESEKGLAEAQRMAHLGNWDWNIVTNQFYWSDEIYRIYGLIPQEYGITCDSFLSYIHPDDRNRIINAAMETWDGKPYSIDHRIISADGEERIVHAQGEVIFEEEKIPVRMKGTIQDITERKKAEEMLKESEGRLKALFKLLPIGVSIIDKQRNILDVTLALEKIMGLSRSDLLKGNHRVRKYLQLNGAEMPYEDLPSVRALKEKGSIHSSEVGMVKENGSIIWADVSAISLPFSDGHVVITVRDITENKKAEEKLQTLANALESSDDAIVTRSLDGSITSWNKGAEQIYGYLTEEVLGKNISMFEPETLKGEIKQLDEKIKQGERIRHYETLRLKKDGTIINISITLSPVFNASGILVAISTVSRDITERKRAEEALIRSENKFRTLAENSPDLIARMDRRTRHLYANPAYSEVHNISQENIIGKTNSELGMDPEKVKFWERHYEHIFATGKPETMEFQYMSPQGKEYYFNTRIVPEFVDGEVTSVLAISRDITERKMAEEAMEKMDKFRIKEIHHRIKNNLQVISSLLSLEAERFSDAKMLEAFRESQGRVTSMALIHEELYKGDETETLDFAAYLRKLTSDLFGSYNLRKDNISVRLDLEQVYLDMDISIPLGIIVNELVSNALKHAFPAGGKGEIHITLYKTGTFAHIYDTPCPNPHYMEKNGSHYILKVSDNGKGIPEEIEFQNADSLGLQLVNILVEQIDGCIELRRNPGTEFTIRFSSKET
ncbi:hypothetical protein EO98_17345 [Methanosarcina sp. 2.H.T.1A.6]|nr:hypothetical protein EO97_06730 [Methanosarcina sp. 2.H.T.1A.15]KKG15108.1 hypothetical protein EO94_04400 [Methanosarcina sp. 2.H.T.1A.3]KKG20808.1 hypothetical protein EO96_18390 [Methanosarcina sp. 2.H.T.1A.8]KKG22125.1 hypothetical protein EO98_17345 [Methanosarcina sp. 2.H.T.1A.6]